MFPGFLLKINMVPHECKKNPFVKIYKYFILLFYVFIHLLSIWVTLIVQSMNGSILFFTVFGNQQQNEYQIHECYMLQKYPKINYRDSPFSTTIFLRLLGEG